MSLDAPPAIAAADPAVDSVIAAEQQAQLHGHARLVGAASVGSVGGALLALWALQGAVPLQRLAAWLVLLAVVLVARWLACRPALATARLVPDATQRMVRRVRLLTLAHGLTWGALAWLPPGPPAVDTLVPLSMLIGAAALIAMTLALFDAQAAAAFAAPALLQLALRWATLDGPLPRYTVVALLMALLMVVVVTGAVLMARRARLEVEAARRAEAQRQRRTEDAAALLQRVFDHIGEGLCMFDAGHRLVAWNARMLTLMGVDAAQARVGTPLRELVVEMGRRGEFGAVDPEAEADRRLQAMRKPGVGFSSRLRPDGSTVELRRDPMPDGGFTLVAVDVSERRASEQALASNRNMLTLLLESTEEGVWFVDNEQRTTDANPAMCRLLGLRREELLGRSIFDFVDAENDAIFRDQVRRRAQGLPGSYEIALRRNDGSLVHCQNNPTPIFDEQGRKIGAVGLFSDITAHKHAEAELKRTSELLAAQTQVLQSTLQSLSQGVLSLGADGRIDAWNRRALELTEVPETVLQGRPTLREMVAYQLQHGLLGTPGDGPRQSWFDEAGRVPAGGAQLLWSTPLYQRERADGTIVEVQLHRALGGGQVRTYTDVTAAVRSERALRASEARFRTMADAAPAFIWQSDPAGRATWFNQAWLQGLGQTLDQALSHPWRDRIHPDDYAHCHAAFEAALAAQRAFDVEYRVVTPDGHELWVADVGIPQRDEQGRLEGYVTYGWNVTARKAAERSLIAARDEAERANRAKSEFLSRMSHELRTPLNAVLGFAQLIERDRAEPPRPVQRERIRQILHGGAHLLELINEVLDLARIESGALPMQHDAVNVDAVMDDCLRLVEPAARQRGLTLDGGAARAGLGDVYTDATRLRQVLLNLLSNAIKYNHPGGRVQLRGQALDGGVRLEVVDTGPGLTSGEQGRLFQAFERLDADRSAVEGTGIGLALSKALVDLMGGRIGVSSVPGVGSTFWVELPRGVAAPAQPGAAPTAAPVPDPVPVAADRPGVVRRVLYIEDNRVNQIVVESMLAQLPLLTVALASEPEDGLRQAFEQPPDLVLLDIQLPGLSGFEVLQQLRQHPATRTVPVVAVSANAMPEDLARAREAGFDDYVTKPLDLDVLLNAVRAWLPPA